MFNFKPSRPQVVRVVDSLTLVIVGDGEAEPVISVGQAPDPPLQSG